jgi:cysteine desulfurase
MDELLALVLVIVLMLIFSYYLFFTGGQNLYFDNNGTTPPYEEVLTVMNHNAFLGNASSSYGDKARDVLLRTSNVIRKWLQLPDTISEKDYKIIFNSGASEGNNTIIRSTVDTYHNRYGRRPHLIISEYEHKSSLTCVKNLQEAGRINVDYISPDQEGLISAKSVTDKINDSTILVSIIMAHNEIGCINPVHSIFAAVKAIRKGILCHTDVVQAFGKYSFTVTHIDALTVSFHKMHGPTGTGILVLSPDAADFVKESPLICGAQNDGLRGGTENIMAIAGVEVALKRTFDHRRYKNCLLRGMKTYLVKQLHANYDIGLYKNYYKNAAIDGATIGRRKGEIVFLGPTNEYGFPSPSKTTPHTLLFSVVKSGKHFCNIKLKDLLLAKGVIVSIGSACNTSSPEPSHSLFALGAPYVIRCGVIRISFGDMNNMKECKKMTKILIDAINEQL